MVRPACWLALLVACSSSGKGDAADAPATSRPNIVFILTDDLNVEVYGHMDRLRALLDDQGTSFRNHFLNISPAAVGQKHRLRRGLVCADDRARPRRARRSRLDHATVNIDFAPTFVDLARLAIPDSVDGRSLVPLLREDPPPRSTWRQVVFLQHAADVGDPVAADGTLEPPDEVLGAPAPPSSPPPFAGIRTAAWTYIEYSTGEKELYDHEADPDQLQNVAATGDPALLLRLGAIVQAIHGCQGATCRAAEMMQP